MTLYECNTTEEQRKTLIPKQYQHIRSANFSLVSNICSLNRTTQ